MTLFEQIAQATKPVNIWGSTMGSFQYATAKYRVYEFHLLADAVAFAEMFGGRFMFGIAAPVDRHVIIVD